MSDDKKDLTSIVDLSKKMEAAGKFPPPEDGEFVADAAPSEKIEHWESLEEYAKINPPPEVSEEDFQASETTESEPASPGDGSQFPVSDEIESSNVLTGLSSVIDSTDSERNSSFEGMAFDPPAKEDGDSEMPFDSPIENNAELTDAELADADTEIEAALSESALPTPELQNIDTESLAANSPLEAKQPTFESNSGIELPVEPVTLTTTEHFTSNEIKVQAPPVSSDFEERQKTAEETLPPERIDGIETIRVENTDSEELPKFDSPSAHPSPSANFTAPEEITTHSGFSLLIEGRLDEYQQNKLKDLLETNPIGIAFEDLLEQIETGKILLPRLSEYAGIFFVQQLRDSNLRMHFGPASAIFAGSQAEASVSLDRSEPSSIREVNFLGDSGGHADQVQLVAGLPPETWKSEGYEPSTSISSSCEWRTTAKSDFRSSSGFQDQVDRLMLSLKLKAYYQGSTRVAHFQIQTHPIAANEGHFRIVALGTLFVGEGGDKKNADKGTTSSFSPPPHQNDSSSSPES